jgi:hypothetical protein
VIWGKREGKSFCGQVWTGQISLIPFTNSLFARNRRSPDERSDIRGIDTRGEIPGLRFARRFFRHCEERRDEAILDRNHLSRANA